MESPLKKKKFVHPQEYFNVMECSDPVNTTIILSDSLFESNYLNSMLRKQFGERKVNIMKLELTVSKVDYLPQFSHVEASCPKRNLLIYFLYSKLVLFNVEKKEIISSIDFERQKIQFDRNGDYVYSTQPLRKIKIEGMETIWEKDDVSHNFSYCSLCESKNEIYVIEKCNENGVEINIFSMFDGSFKRKLDVKCMIELENYELKDLKCDEELATVYLTFKRRKNSNACSDFVLIFEESSNKSIVKEIDNIAYIGLIRISGTAYFYCATFFDQILYLFERNNYEKVVSFSFECISTLDFLYFERFTNCYYHHNGFKISFNITETISDIPINKEIYQKINKLGVELPSIIPLTNDGEESLPLSLTYLFSIDFTNAKLLYKDEKLSRYFACISLEYDDPQRWADSEEFFFIGSLCIDHHEPYVRSSLYLNIRKSEVLNNGGDFPVYIMKQHNSCLETLMFSELISKLSNE